MTISALDMCELYVATPEPSGFKTITFKQSGELSLGSAGWFFWPQLGLTHMSGAGLYCLTKTGLS